MHHTLLSPEISSSPFCQRQNQYPLSFETNLNRGEGGSRHTVPKAVLYLKLIMLILTNTKGVTRWGNTYYNPQRTKI